MPRSSAGAGREALRQTLRKRPDLLAGADLGAADRELLEQIRELMTATPERPLVAWPSCISRCCATAAAPSARPR